MMRAQEVPQALVIHAHAQEEFLAIPSLEISLDARDDLEE
jgi:hypothetical protein